MWSTGQLYPVATRLESEFDKGTTYYASVRAVDQAGNTSALPKVMAGVCNSSLHLQCPHSQCYKYIVTWSAVTGATSYNLYWATASGVTTSSSVITGVTSTYTHSSLTGGTTYYYRVAAVKSGVVGELSSESSATPYIGTVADPAISPSSGTFSSTQSVSITTSTAGSSIRYTVDDQRLLHPSARCTPEHSRFRQRQPSKQSLTKPTMLTRTFPPRL